jgi:PAS domain S-box-containing protein
MSMKRRNVSIAVVLSAALVGTITLLLGVFAAVYYAAEKEQRLGQLRHSVGTSADQQATALALSIWDLDEPHIIAILRSGMQQQEILAIAVSSNGKIYVQGRDANWNVGAVEREPASDGLLVGERPIKHRDELLGTVRVYVTPKFLDEDLAQQRASIVGFILLLDATLVLSLYWLVWHLMLKPLKAVERFAASVQAGQRVDAGPDDIWRFGEIEALSDSIRGMTDMLDSRYHALRASEERLKLATRASHIGIWDWDVLRNEMVWDDKMFSLYGCERATFGGTYDAWCKTLEREDFQKALDDVAAALRGEREFASEFKIRLPDGSTRVLKGDAMTIRDADGRVCRMVGVNFDVTERKQAEKEILALNTELDQRVRERTAQLQATNVELGRSRDAAESATLAKSEFLANMSHEIRTPMNAIIGMTDLALRGDMSAKQRGYLTKAKTAANSLLIIINDILDFSKIEAGKLDMEVREFVLQQVLERVTAVVGLKAQEKGLELLMNTADDVPPALIGDSLRLEQVLINLCANAVKFTTHGEIVVVTVKSVVVDEDRITLRFSVRDTGIGMSEQQMQGLFRPFNQLDASTTRRHGGTGLGLAICKKLVGLMGGEIGVKSQLGRGSDFHFTATFDLPEQRALASAPAPGLRDLHVLVIDDSANARDIFQGLLRGLGLRPTMASSASGGLARRPSTSPTNWCSSIGRCRRWMASRSWHNCAARTQTHRRSSWSRPTAMMR